MPLKEYNKKRQFNKTPEPSGSVTKEKGKRFVVQKHSASHLHWDFRLEMDGVLKSWAVPKGPPLKPHEKRLAVHVEDHPVGYINFKGTIPKGNYGAGKVQIWDKGKYELLEKSDKNIKFILYGKKLNGPYDLVNFKDKNWLLFKNAGGKIPVKSKGKLIINAGKKSRLPEFTPPMLATLTQEVFSDPDFIYETKWDGYRALARISGKDVRLTSRNNVSFNLKYPAVVEALSFIRGRVILDGEIVVFNENSVPSFQLLQDFPRDNVGDIKYYVFDILYLNGRDLRELPLIDRKKILSRVVRENSVLKLSSFIEEQGQELFNLAKKKGYEGIIAKKKNSIYVGRRSSDWQKIKNIWEQEALICGYTEPLGSREGFGALVLGVYDKGKLKYVGHTGGGFDEKKIREIKARLEPLTITQSPFEDVPRTNTPVTWVKPKLIAEIKFAQWTNDKKMRQPVFVALRSDKEPSEVTFEKKTSRRKRESTIKEFSNLDKVFWPKDGYTKGNVIEYYKNVSGFILPHLHNRPQSLNRHPNGIEGESFFQKNIEDAPSWIKTVKIHSEGEERDINYMICNDRKTLMYMANLGCIEINPWSSRVSKLENPDYLVIDLDPEGVDFDTVVEVALSSKKILDKAKMESFIKTSGKSGMHILIPLGAKYNYDQVRSFAEILAKKISSEMPEITSVERLPQKRQKKVYIDFLQNRLGQTIASPYSLRPSPGAPVSTPLEWKEVKKGINPGDFNIKNMERRLKIKGDIWKKLIRNRGINMLNALNLLSK